MPQKPVILETVSIYVLFKEIKQPREKLHKKGDNSYTPHKIKVNTAPAVSNCMAPILSHSYIHFTHFQKKINIYDIEILSKINIPIVPQGHYQTRISWKARAFMKNNGWHAPAF